MVARGTRVYDSAAALILMGDWCVLVYTTITQPLERNPGRVERQARDLATEMNRRASRAIDDLSLVTRRRLMGDPIYAVRCAILFAASLTDRVLHSDV